MVAAFGAITMSGCSASPDARADVSPVQSPLLAMDPALVEEVQAGVERHEQLFRDVTACMEADGWSVVDLGNQTFTIEGISPEQQTLANETYRQCSESTGWSRSTAIDSSSLARLYEYELKTLDCLESIGWEVTEAPPFEVYMERFNTSNAWSAYTEISEQMTEAEVEGNEDLPGWDEVNAMCPQPLHWADLN